MLGKLIRTLITVAAAACAVAVPLGQAVASPSRSPSVTVAPNQDFRGLVNAKTSKAVLHVFCPGIAKTGHPLPRQTVGVGLVIDPVTPNDGVTGKAASSIGAWLTWPTTVAPPPPAYVATFTSYRTVRIPTSITVPCSGSGEMLFLPAKGSPTVKAATVSLTFVNIGV
jgi:hypothetical protein